MEERFAFHFPSDDQRPAERFAFHFPETPSIIIDVVKKDYRPSRRRIFLSQNRSLCAAEELYSDASLGTGDRRALNNSKNWQWTTAGFHSRQTINGCVCNGLMSTEPDPKEPKRKINRKRDEPLTVLARNSRAGVSKLLSLVDPFRRKYFFSSFIYFCNILNPIQLLRPACAEGASSPPCLHFVSMLVMHPRSGRTYRPQ
ncbi:hypothetical protein TNCV_4186821 [Trichonephila clavipes]|nr:hypothetical protein TNCV_4186821 [Trichonephila clavipes]